MSMQTTLKMTNTGLQSSYQWGFKKYFRSRAYGWRGSQLAIKRMKEALKEINQVKKHSSLLAAEGAIYLMSRFWPAFEHIDTSSGSLGNAVCGTMEQLLPIIIEAPADLSTREHWLDILWEVLQNDGVDYVSLIADYWGELAGYKEEASRRADEFLWIVKRGWKEHHSIVHYDVACLSALFYAGRYEEILALIELDPYPSWWARKFGARVLALTDPDKAITYAEDTRHFINTNQLSIDQYCEDVLLNAGRIEEAYERYGIYANRANTYLTWFTGIKKKYSNIRIDREILLDLIDQDIAEPGKWFATANKIGCYDIALKLIQESPADPKTLNRAAEKHLATNPDYALKVAFIALQWMIRGYGYEITGLDVHAALSVIKQAAIATGEWNVVKNQLRKIINENAPTWCLKIISMYLVEPNMREDQV